MTDFCKHLQNLCAMAEIDIQTALRHTTKYANNAKTGEEKIYDGLVPDTDTINELALYFNVGLDMLFDPDSNLSPINESKPKTYLAGPITGKPDAQRQFQAAQAYLESNGYLVFNPLSVTSQLPSANMNRDDFINLGLCLLNMCESIALMPGWEKSSGCKAEHAYAVATKKWVWNLTPENMAEGRNILKSNSEKEG